MTDLSQLTNEQLLALQPAPVSVQPLPPPQGQNSHGQPLASPSYNLDLSQLTPEQLQQLQASAANNDPNMSPAEDWGRAAITGLEKGVTGVGGALGDARQLGGSIANFEGRQLAHAFGQDPPGQIYDPKAIGATDVLNPAMLAFKLAPTTPQIQAPLKPTFHTPQTVGGDYAERIGEFAPMAALPGGPVARLARALVPGVASQFAENRVSAPYKPIAALVGALAGGGVVGAGEKMAVAPQASFGNAMGNLSDNQIALAQALRQDAAGRSLDISLPEAVQQVTNNGTGLGRLQRVVEGTKRGQVATAPYFANRPQQVTQAVHSFIDTIAPPTDQPGMVGLRAQRAADDVLRSAEQARTAYVTPDYTAADSQRVQPDAINGVLQNIDDQIAADKTGLLSGKLGELRDALTETPAQPGRPAVPPERVKNGATYQMVGGGPAIAPTPRVPLTDIGNLDRVRKFFRDRISQPPLGSDAFTKEQAAAVTQHLQNVDQAMETVPAFLSGKNKFQQFTQVVNDPLNAGPPGTMAKTSDVGALTGAYYPSNPLEGSPAETAQAVRALDAVDPSISSDLTRQHLARALNQATRDLQSGQNQYGGSRYAVSIAGNPEQAATLRAGVSALPDGDAKAADLDGLLEALRATGKRQPPGSMTAFNEGDLKAFGITPAVKFMQSLNIAEPLEPISNALAGINYRRNVDGLAKMIMADPDKTAEVLAAARKASGKPSAGPLLPALLAAPKGSGR